MRLAKQSYLICFFFIVYEKDIKYRILVYIIQSQKWITGAKVGGKVTKGRGVQRKKGKILLQNLHICWHIPLILYREVLEIMKNICRMWYFVDLKHLF